MSSSFNNSRNSPKYAVVHLPEGTNVINFYQLLLSNGFSEVSFVNEIRENAFLPSIMGGSCLSSNENKNDLTNKNIISTNNETINPTIEKVVDSVAKIREMTTENEIIKIQNELEISGRKKCYRSHNVTTKLEAIDWARKNSVHSASRKFNVDRKIIRNWIKNEEKLEQQNSLPGGQNRKRLSGGGRKILNQDFDMSENARAEDGQNSEFLEEEETVGVNLDAIEEEINLFFDIDN